MNESQLNGRLGWLSVTLATHRNNIANILLRLRGIGVRAGTSLALHRKFMCLLEQVAVDREKELDMLNEIDAVEKRHGEMRERRLLRRASYDTRPRFVPPAPVQKPESRPAPGSLLKLIGLMMLFSGPSVKHRQKDFTPD